ncbi:hypothetical protein Xbed_03781 [Xenorhabdus beddingii]|uniref:Uncharacterized protein n=1 Tax=Xenorhabdus beddingii TaxID=40578 RepID=A0A1Y2S5Q7_9GAMM|nr:hypothetical protein Xbed_03781 [Xenorhabdus beddingii]
MVNPAVLIKGQAPEVRPDGKGVQGLIAIGAGPVGMGDNAGDFALLGLIVKNLQCRFLHQQRG